MAAGISMLRFSQADNHNIHNILDTGEINLVVQHVDSLPGTTQKKIEILLDCLSQTFSFSGINAGKCESVLKRELFARATVSHVEAQQTIEKAPFKHNPKLVDTLQRMRLLASGVLNINLSEFTDPNYTNLLENGASNLVIDYIANDHARPIGIQIRAFLDCLAQAQAIGGRYASKCESDFKAKIYALAQANPADVQTFIQNNLTLKEDARFKDVIKAMENLATRNMDIDLSHFSDGVNNDIDILKTGKINLVIAYIVNHAPNVQAQIETYLRCFSQTASFGGQFQGLCESQLQHMIYQFAIAHRVQAQAAIGIAQFKYDPKLTKVIQIICQLTGDILNIHMSEFFTPSGIINIIDTGKIDLIIHHVDNNALNRQEKVKAYLNCLSQTLLLNGRNQGACEEALKQILYDLSTAFPNTIQDVLKGEKFKHNPKLQDVLKKMHYLSNGIFGKRSRFSNYLCRVGHHLYDTLTNNKSFGVTYIAASTSLILVSGLQTAFSQTLDKKQVRDGWSMVSVGAGMISIPFLNAFNLAFYDET